MPTTDLRPTHYGGHSLGEYAALVAAGVLNLGEAVRLVRERGRRMQEAVPPGKGGMLAATARKLDAAVVQGCLDGLVVDVASVNAPGQMVLSGLVDDLRTAAARLRAAFGSALQLRPLDVSAPFHCRLMTVVEANFRAMLQQASATWQIRRAAYVVSNYTRTFYAADRDAVVDGLTRQISGCVRWAENARALAALSPKAIVEVGPSSRLRSFFLFEGTRARAVTSVADARALRETYHVG